MAVAAADVAKATAVVVGLAGAFLDQQAGHDEAYLRDQLGARAASGSDVEAVLAEELDRARAFRLKAEERMRRDLPAALALPDTPERTAAVQAITAREAVYVRQREEAMLVRAIAAIDRMVLRRESPTGALWLLDPTVKEHTEGCLKMGGKFHPWPVLDRVHPPRHAGCPCRLIGYGEAIRRGLLTPGAVLDVVDAIKRASSVVMEFEVPELVAA